MSISSFFVNNSSAGRTGNGIFHNLAYTPATAPPQEAIIIENSAGAVPQPQIQQLHVHDGVGGENSAALAEPIVEVVDLVDDSSSPDGRLQRTDTMIHCNKANNTSNYYQHQ
eukprot:Pgem_evm1s19031